MGCGLLFLFPSSALLHSFYTPCVPSALFLALLIYLHFYVSKKKKKIVSGCILFIYRKPAVNNFKDLPHFDLLILVDEHYPVDVGDILCGALSTLSA